MKIFVPGRICLFGEHSDWAGGYRRINADIEKGYTLICGTNQGIHAEVEPHPTALVLTSTTPDGTIVGPTEIPLEPRALLEEAQRGGFFSYAAGVAYQVLTHYRVRGLVIHNTRTDLPIKKGLSSSAAICVLTARAFNRVYDLRLTIRGEMELAYQGEITTPSRCGRMDQGCAFGDRADRHDVRRRPHRHRRGAPGAGAALGHRRSAREEGHARDPQAPQPLLPVRRERGGARRAGAAGAGQQAHRP